MLHPPAFPGGGSSGTRGSSGGLRPRLLEDEEGAIYGDPPEGDHSEEERKGKEEQVEEGELVGDLSGLLQRGRKATGNGGQEHTDMIRYGSGACVTPGGDAAPSHPAAPGALRGHSDNPSLGENALPPCRGSAGNDRPTPQFTPRQQQGSVEAAAAGGATVGGTYVLHPTSLGSAPGGSTAGGSTAGLSSSTSSPPTGYLHTTASSSSGRGDLPLGLMRTSSAPPHQSSSSGGAGELPMVHEEEGEDEEGERGEDELSPEDPVPCWHEVVAKLTINPITGGWVS